MTRAMALEFALVVRVHCVCPGYVDADMVRRDGIDEADDPAAEERRVIDKAPLKRMVAPREVATAFLYPASDDARFATGGAFQIDGGTRPSVFDGRTGRSGRPGPAPGGDESALPTRSATIFACGAGIRCRNGRPLWVRDRRSTGACTPESA